MPKISIVSKEEYDIIHSQASAASEILEDERFKFIRDYLENASRSVEKAILENTVHDVREIVTITDKLTRLFFTPKKIQVDEMVGQYKFIKKYFEDLNQFIEIKNDLDRAIQSGVVKVEK